MNAPLARETAIPFGARSLLAFVLEPKTPLAEWLESLDVWLARSPNFFAAKPVMLQMAGVDITLKDYRDLLAQLARRHVRVMAVENSDRMLVGPHLPPLIAGGRVISAEKMLEPADEPSAPAPPPLPIHAESLFHEGALRSGQRIVHLEGDVCVLGRVASGAEIVAGGSVHVYGALQGRVFAGVAGPEGARVFCRELRAELICIGGLFITAEEMDAKLDGQPVEALLQGDQIKLRAIV